MPLEPQLVELGFTSLDEETNLLSTQATVPITSEEDDKASFGDCGTISALGVTSRSYPPDYEGNAEGVLISGVGNQDGVIVGGRDPRCAGVYGKLEPGDTALHSCAPGAASQVLCYGSDKNGNKVVAMTEGTNGKNMTVTLDGENDQIVISGMAAAIIIDEHGIFMGKGESSILITEKGTFINGELTIGNGITPPDSQLIAWNSAALATLQGLGVPVKPAQYINVTSQK